MRRLHRSHANRVWAGVCGGIGEYANIDPVLIRLIWLLITIFSGVVPGLIGYLLAIIVIPEGPTAHLREEHAN